MSCDENYSVPESQRAPYYTAQTFPSSPEEIANSDQEFDGDTSIWQQLANEELDMGVKKDILSSTQAKNSCFDTQDSNEVRSQKMSS